MRHRKPTLARMILRRYLWAAAVTSSVVMCGLLLLTDSINLSAHRRALAERLRAIEAIDPDTPSSLGIYSKGSPHGASFLLLDEHGRWSAGDPTVHMHPKHAMPYWSEAPRVLAAGELEGRGTLPWESDPVVWAARPIHQPGSDGHPMILVAWRREGSIRIANTAPYAAVILAILIAFVISAIISLQISRYVRRVVDTIAQSSSRMASGDFEVLLPTQPTEELDRVSNAIVQLARDLDRTTADLRTEHERLERMERLQRQFVADASHELRAPLTSMRVTLEAWQDGVVRPEEQPKALEQLLAETARLGTLVTRLLDLSRIESGREPVDIVPVAVADVAVQILKRFNTHQGARVTNEVPDDFPPVLADPDALYRILQNLVENAQRCTPADGSIHIRAHVDGEQARIAVSDTGCGIAPASLPRIWDRFARAAEARAEGRSGSGLGLAIVKGLADAMSGEVGAESTPGQGTTVWVRLPLAEK